MDMTLHAVMIQLEDYRTYSFKTCDAATQRIDQPIRRRLITKREYKEWSNFKTRRNAKW